MSRGSLYQGKGGRNLLYVREIRDIDLFFTGRFTVLLYSHRNVIYLY